MKANVNLSLGAIHQTGDSPLGEVEVAGAEGAAYLQFDLLSLLWYFYYEY